MRTVRITVHGRVQGVGFRYALRAEAERRRVRGWVRNRRDGAVEALLTGEEPAVDALLSWAHEGPPSARVDEVEVTRSEGDDAEGFEIRPTA